MRRCAVTLAVLGTTLGVPSVAHGTPTEMAVAASTIPGRTLVATNLLDMTQGAYDAPAGRRFDTVRAVSITPRQGQVRYGREFVRPADEIPAERRVESQTVAKDIRSTGSSRVKTGISFVSFGKPMPDPGKAQTVESRAITRAAAPAERLVVAQSGTSAVGLQEVLQEVRSSQGRSATVTVDISKPSSSQPAAVRTASSADAEVTIVGRRGQRVIEITDTDFQDIDRSAPVLNRMNAEAIAQQQAAREALEARNEELRAERAAQEEQQQAEAAAEAAAEASSPAPPGPRDQEMIRRYDWRKGIYVRVPADEPPVPRPSVATGPAGLVEREQSGGAFRGLVPRKPAEAEPETTAEPQPAEATN